MQETQFRCDVCGVRQHVELDPEDDEADDRLPKDWMHVAIRTAEQPMKWTDDDGEELESEVERRASGQVCSRACALRAVDVLLEKLKPPPWMLRRARRRKAHR